LVYLFQILNGLGLGVIYFLLAVGLSVIFGLLRFVNFAHGAFYMVGAYLTYEATRDGASFWLALPLAALGVAALAGLVEALLLRRVYKLDHAYHILVTVGVALVIQELTIIIWGPIGASVAPPSSLSGVLILGQFIYPQYRLFVIGFTAILAFLLWWLLEGTRLGALVRAGSESAETMALLGFDTPRINTAVFALGAGLAGLAGALAAPIRGVEPFMAVEAVGVAFAVVVIGGMGSYLGALAASLLVGVIQGVMATLWPQGASLMIYLTMAALIAVRPRGLFGRA